MSEFNKLIDKYVSHLRGESDITRLEMSVVLHRDPEAADELAALRARVEEQAARIAELEGLFDVEMTGKCSKCGNEISIKINPNMTAEEILEREG